MQLWRACSAGSECGGTVFYKFVRYVCIKKSEEWIYLTRTKETKVSVICKVSFLCYEVHYQVFNSISL